MVKDFKILADYSRLTDETVSFCSFVKFTRLIHIYFKTKYHKWVLADHHTIPYIHMSI